MSTLTIKTNVTLHVPAKGHVPFEFDPNGATLSGHYQADKIPPGTEVTLDEDEARAIIARHGGEIISAQASNPASAAKPAAGKTA